MQTFVSMFYSLVLLIKKSIHMLSVYGVMFHLFQEILTKKNNCLRLRWLRQRQAEAETETSHVVMV